MQHPILYLLRASQAGLHRDKKSVKLKKVQSASVVIEQKYKVQAHHVGGNVLTCHVSIARHRVESF